MGIEDSELMKELRYSQTKFEHELKNKFWEALHKAITQGTLMIPDKKPFYIRGHDRASRFIGLPKEKTDQPIGGWRTWRITTTSEGWRLRSVTVDSPWESPVMTTNVENDGKLARVATNNKARYRGDRGDYGVYSYKDLETLAHWHGFRGVVGRIENYGHVVEHEFGYRAQKCVIRSLYMLVSHMLVSHIYAAQIRRTFEEIYHCPVKIVYHQGMERIITEIRTHEKELENNG